MDVSYQPITSTFDETIRPMCTPKRIVTLTPQEHRFVIQSLIEILNELLKEGKYSNYFDDLCLKSTRQT